MFRRKKSPDADTIKARDAEFDKMLSEVIAEQTAIAQSKQTKAKKN